jgi:hypothetical protein
LNFSDISPYTKLKKALVQEKDHEELFQRFSELQLNNVPNWLAMVTAWEQDHTNPNPYVIIKSGKPILLLYHLTFAKLRLTLQA